MGAQPKTISGGCLCGEVIFEIDGPFRGVVACHCSQCRKTSGHYVAATSVRKDGLRLLVNSGLQWYRSSDIAERGFCNKCGSSLFWRQDESDRISIHAGCLDAPTGLRMTEQICVRDASDYYDIDPRVPLIDDLDAPENSI